MVGGFFWIRIFGAFIIWTFKGFKGKIKDIEENNVYSFYVGLITSILLIYLMSKIEV
jgi:hypothetical protein